MLRYTDAELTAILESAKDNVCPTAVQEENGVQLSCHPFDDYKERVELVAVWHDDFLTVGLDGDSETFDTTELGWAGEAAATVNSFLDSLD